MAITESLVETVSEHVGDAKVVRIVLELGRFSGVASDAVRFCFDVCAEGTALEGALLEIVEIPARARCRRCELHLEPDDGIGLCPCGSMELEFSSGRELRIREVEVI